MEARAISVANLRTDFLKSVEARKVFKVPQNLFPLAVDPPTVPASAANFMRPADWVVGVVIGNVARAYPAWILDNYHAVNDSLDGVQIAVMHCEICCSNAVYRAGLSGKRLIFGTAGLYGGTLAVYDTETISTWSHGMGVAFDGPLKGVALDRIPSFQARWDEWLSFYPESTVMEWQAPRSHPDGRHGHGSQDTFGHAGMYAEPVSTMIVGNDNRMKEHEMVLTVISSYGAAAIPLIEIARAGGMLQFKMGSVDFVSICDGPASSFIGTFYRHLATDPTRRLDFQLIGGRPTDIQTRSVWRADGHAVAGPLSGCALEPLATMINKWHSLACFLPGIRILRHRGEPAEIKLGEAESAVQAIRNHGYNVGIGCELYSLEVPNGAVRGFHVSVDGDPFDLFLFEHESVAEDYCLCRSHSERCGRLVLESSPARRFRDDLNVHRLSDDEVEWSALLGQERFRDAVRMSGIYLQEGIPYSSPNISALYRTLTESGHDVAIESECPRDALPPGALFGVQWTVDGDPFLAYRFEDSLVASRYAAECGHCVATGSLVLRSNPDVYFIPRPLSTMRRPDESIQWSALLNDELFSDQVKSVLT